MAWNVRQISHTAQHLNATLCCDIATQRGLAGSHAGAAKSQIFTVR